MKIEIIDRTGDISIYEDLKESYYYENEVQFNVISPDYILEVTKSNDEIYEVTNAVDGWGNNCKDTFRNASITIYN